MLFDTGFLVRLAAPTAMDAHAQAWLRPGYKPEDISMVVLTHMHGDHIGGLMERTQAGTSRTPVMSQARLNMISGQRCPRRNPCRKRPQECARQGEAAGRQDDLYR